MTTPRFTLSQDDEFVVASIHTPYVRVKDMEFTIEDNVFLFYCKPYFLRLTFSHKLLEDERAKAVYDIDKDNGTITCHLPKENVGEFFEDLDLVSKLLKPASRDVKDELPTVSSLENTKAKNRRKGGAPLIEILSSTVSDGDKEEEETLSEVKCYAHSAVPPATSRDSTRVINNLLNVGGSQSLIYTKDEIIGEHDVNILLPSSDKLRYGFDRKYKDVFRGLECDLSLILELPQPEDTDTDTRGVLKKQTEELKFNEYRYMEDFVETDDIFTASMRCRTHWNDALSRKQIKLAENSSTNKKIVLIEDVTTSLNEMSLEGEGIAPAHNTVMGKVEESTSISLSSSGALSTVENEEMFGGFTNEEKVRMSSSI
jgi:hypothetical protein